MSLKHYPPRDSELFDQRIFTLEHVLEVFTCCGRRLLKNIHPFFYQNWVKTFDGQFPEFQDRSLGDLQV